MALPTYFGFGNGLLEGELEVTCKLKPCCQEALQDLGHNHYLGLIMISCVKLIKKFIFKHKTKKRATSPLAKFQELKTDAAGFDVIGSKNVFNFD